LISDFPINIAFDFLNLSQPLVPIFAREHGLDVLHHFLVVDVLLLFLSCNQLCRRYDSLVTPPILYLTGVRVERSGAGRTEIGVEALAPPGGLDDQDRFVQVFLQRDAKGQFRPEARVS
jgi:hypothetical protein